MALTRMDAYRILGVPYNSDLLTCKKAYHLLCKQYHPDNISGEVAEKDAAAFSLLQEAYALVQEKEAIPEAANPVRENRGARIFGNPASAVATRKRNAENERRNAILKRQLEYEKLKEKSRELAQREKEEKILDQIRWIRLTDIIRKSLEEDARKEELSRKAQDAIRKVREQDDFN